MAGTIHRPRPRPTTRTTRKDAEKLKRATKVKQALARRQAVWDDLIADGYRGGQVKMVRHDNKMKAFHRPGSQNAKKGGSGRSANR